MTDFEKFIRDQVAEINKHLAREYQKANHRNRQQAMLEWINRYAAEFRSNWTNHCFVRK